VLGRRDWRYFLALTLWRIWRRTDRPQVVVAVPVTSVHSHSGSVSASEDHGEDGRCRGNCDSCGAFEVISSVLCGLQMLALIPSFQVRKPLQIVSLFTSAMNRGSLKSPYYPRVLVANCLSMLCQMRTSQIDHARPSPQTPSIASVCTFQCEHNIYCRRSNYAQLSRSRSRDLIS
jgi:hypothetical protein